MASGVLSLWLASTALAAAANGAPATPEATIMALQGHVQYAQGASELWRDAAPNLVLYPGDVLRTSERSRVSLRLRDGSALDIAELSTLRFETRETVPLLRLLRGFLYFFHRERPGSVDVQGPWVNAGILGTEFAFGVADDGTTTLALYDGVVRLSNPHGELRLSSRETARIEPDGPPRPAARLLPHDFAAIQWALYYPAIVDPAELDRPPAPEPALASALELYRSGDLPRALAAYPRGRTPASAGERLFLAALLLSVGSVAEAETHLAAVPPEGRPGRLAEAQRRLIAAVLRRADDADPAATPPPSPHPPFATERLADAYRLQARSQLEPARDAALDATRLAPDFGFAWVRYAELEFALGNLRAARVALERALTLSPANAEAHALHGFVLAAANRLADARQSFERAISLDGALANGWLGRGLCRIRQGDLAGGRADLQIAAATEPQRALLRSYLAKAFADSAPFTTPARPALAHHELELARDLDPRDPTPWLYSALLDQQGNRINDAVDDLHESQVRNDNRALYRSRLGLDQDRAVRSANLANIFADAGLQDIGLREATRAVNADYANAAAHLFLANSYDALRDPRQINLRYETPWYSEYLLANLLAPVGAGSLSQTVAQNEYSKLFERDRLGLVNTTTWTGNGDWLQRSAQFGQSGNFAYALDAEYRSEVGQRINNDLEQLALSATAKIQAGPADSFLLQASWYDAEYGDVLQRYDPASAVAGMRLWERHEPLALVGWHHEWRPGMHTLALVSPWNASQHFVNPANTIPWVSRADTGEVTLGDSAAVVPLDAYHTRLTGVSAELQQLWQTDDHTVVGGLRYQYGGFDTTARLRIEALDPNAPADSATDPRLERFSVYAYDQWEVCRGVLLTAGVAYDRLTQPSNFRTAPLTQGTDTLDRISPKLGLTITPWRGGTLRGAWTRSLGGVAFDQSFRLEPVQVAGFNQAYRGLIPESLVGSVSGQQFETFGLALDQVLPTRTWLTLAAELLTSDASRDIGGFTYDENAVGTVTAFRQDLDFTERSISLAAGQLIGRDLSVTLRYRLADAELDTRYPGLAYSDDDFATTERSVLQQLTLGLRYQHPVGFFASWESTWTHQSNHDDAARFPGDNFWQHNVWAGWRFWQRRAELAIGLLNLTDEDYRLHPLNYYRETYRDRTVAVTGRFAF